MIDVTSTSFGLIIAYLLPGMTCLYGLGYFIDGIDKAFATFLTDQSSFSLLIVLLVSALICGLIISPLRWIAFECFFCKNCDRSEPDFSAIGNDQNKLTAFRALVDEQYRYHQFWGGIVFSLPVLVAGIIYRYTDRLGVSGICILGTISFGLILIISNAAIKAYDLYICRAQLILGGIECQTGGGKP